MSTIKASNTRLEWHPVGQAPGSWWSSSSAAGRVWGTTRSRIKGFLTLQSFRFFWHYRKLPSLKQDHALQVLSSRGRPLDDITLKQVLQDLAPKPGSSLIPINSLYLTGSSSYEDANKKLTTALKGFQLQEGEKRQIVIPISTPPTPEKVKKYQKTARNVSLILFPITIPLGALFLVFIVLETLLIKLPSLAKWNMRTLRFARRVKNPLIGHITTALIEMKKEGEQITVISIEHFDLKGLHPKEYKMADSEQTVGDLLARLCTIF